MLLLCISDEDSDVDIHVVTSGVMDRHGNLQLNNNNNLGDFVMTLMVRSMFDALTYSSTLTLTL